MAVTCSKCSKTISRNDESITCSANSSHIYHVECVKVSKESEVQIEKQGVLKEWNCNFCSANITSHSNNLDPNQSLFLSLIGEEMRKGMETFLHPVLESMRAEINNLKKEISALTTENKELHTLLHGYLKGSQQTHKVKHGTKIGSTHPTVTHNKEKSSNSDMEIQNKCTEEKKAKSTSNQKSVSSVLSQLIPTTSADEEFKLVESRKSTRRSTKRIIGIGKGENITIKSAPKYGHLHVCKLHPTLKTEDLTTYLKMNGFEDIKCEKLESNRPEEYSSFKISVQEGDFEKIKNPEIWPEGTCINNFLFRLARRNVKI